MSDHSPGQEGMVRNTSWLLLGDVVAKIAGFVFVVLVARIVGRAEYGYFTFGFSFVTLLLLVGRWGLSTAIQQEIARGGERISQVRASAFAFLTIAGLVVLTIVYATSPLFVEGTEAFWTIVIVGAALLLDEFTILNLAVFVALEKMRYPAIVIMSNRIASTILTATILLFVDSIIAVSVMFLLGSLGALLGSTILVRRYVEPVHLRDVTKESLAWQFRFGSSLGVASLLNAGVFRADAVMLQAIKGPVAVGLYGAAYRFFESFLFVAWSLGTVLFPRAVRAGAAESRIAYLKLAAVMLSFYLPLAVGTPFVAEWMIVGLFSERYEGASAAVVWLMCGGLFFSFAYLSRMALIALERRKLIAWVAGSTLVINVTANLLLIPEHSYTGAAAATFLSSVFEAAILTTLFFRYSERRGDSRLLLVPIVASAVMAATLLLADLRDLRALVVAPLVYIPAWIAIATRLAPTLTDEVRRIVARKKANPAA